MDYRVSWKIDVDAETPDEAAATARIIQLDRGSLANVFTVTDSEGNDVTVTVAAETLGSASSDADEPG